MFLNWGANAKEMAKYIVKVDPRPTDTVYIQISDGLKNTECQIQDDTVSIFKYIIDNCMWKSFDGKQPYAFHYVLT